MKTTKSAVEVIGEWMPRHGDNRRNHGNDEWHLPLMAISIHLRHPSYGSQVYITHYPPLAIVITPLTVYPASSEQLSEQSSRNPIAFSVKHRISIRRHVGFRRGNGGSKGSTRLSTRCTTCRNSGSSARRRISHTRRSGQLCERRTHGRRRQLEESPWCAGKYRSSHPLEAQQGAGRLVEGPYYVVPLRLTRPTSP